MLRDHLGSASVTLDASGAIVPGGEQRYYPFGESRIEAAALPTDRLFTGQREIADFDIGLYHYNARFYSPSLGRFVSADTVVADTTLPQAYNRFSYVFNNPIRHTDPSGHCPTPRPEWGAGICFALFIKSAVLNIPNDDFAIFTVRGDDRDFSPQSDPSQSRVWVYISLDQNIAYTSINPSMYFHANPPPYVPDNDGKPGEWIVADPSSQNVVSVATYNGHYFVAYDAVISGILSIHIPGTQLRVSPHINGVIHFQPKEGGGFTATGTRDGFPWAEAYYHNGNGGVFTIFTDPAIQENPHNLGSMGDNFTAATLAENVKIALGQALPLKTSTISSGSSSSYREVSRYNKAGRT